MNTRRRLEVNSLCLRWVSNGPNVAEEAVQQATLPPETNFEQATSIWPYSPWQSLVSSVGDCSVGDCSLLIFTSNVHF